MAKRSSIKLSDTEWSVMNAVWAHPTWVSARDVLEATAQERDWAYTTVKTLLARLVEKGALEVRKRGNTSQYQALVSREAARGGAVQSLLERAFDGAFGSLVQHMLSEEKLSKRERERLRRLLEEER